MTGFAWLIIKHDATEPINPVCRLADVIPWNYASDHIEDHVNCLYDTMTHLHEADDTTENFNIKVEFSKHDACKSYILNSYTTREDAVGTMHKIAERLGYKIQEYENEENGLPEIKITMREDWHVMAKIMSVPIKHMFEYAKPSEEQVAYYLKGWMDKKELGYDGGEEESSDSGEEQVSDGEEAQSEAQSDDEEEYESSVRGERQFSDFGEEMSPDYADETDDDLGDAISSDWGKDKVF
jgi:hypothetical protein